MSEKIYCGSGKVFGRFNSINLSVCLDDIPSEYKKTSKNGKVYCNLILQQKKNVDQYGNTHCIEVDTWKPNSNNQKNVGHVNHPAGKVNEDSQSNQFVIDLDSDEDPF